MRFFKRGETADSKFTFLDNTTGEPIDVVDPAYTIVHYNDVLEVVEVNITPLTKVAGRIGQYIAYWEIPNNAIENETYFVIATGRHPVDNSSTVIEDFYRVISGNYFSNGGSSSGMTIKFTKA